MDNPFRKSRRFDSPNLISVQDFIKETKEDFKSPTTSNFTKIMPECHETVVKLSEVIDTNRENFRTVKRSLKEIAKGLSINYVGKISPIFTPPLRKQVYYISLCSSIGIWLTPFPLSCLHSLWMVPNDLNPPFKIP